MKRIGRGAWLCASIAVLVGAAVHAAPLKIGSEQQAAATWSLASNFHIGIEGEVTGTPDGVLRKVLLSMRDLDEVSSPQSLMASRSGISVPCAFGGSFLARMPQARPGILKIDWAACVQEADEYSNSTLDGPVTLKLSTHSFAPERIDSLRVGSKTEDVVWTTNYVDPESPQIHRGTFNFSMRGTIPTTRLFEQGYFTGDGDYRLHGSWSSIGEWLLDGSWSSSSSTVENARIKRSVVYTENNTILARSFQMVRGSVTTRIEYPAPWYAREYRFSASNFRARELTDFNDFVTVTQQTWIDGKVDYEYAEGYSPGCMSGEYVLKTRVPMTNRSLFTKGERDEGEIVMNNAIVRLYSSATVPPNLPAPTGKMLTVVDVKEIGLFSFDSDWTSPRAIVPLSQCY